MKKIILLAMAIVLSSCAGQQLKSDWTQKRGYSKADVDLIMAQYKQYSSAYINAEVSSNAFNSTPKAQEENKLRRIFCACVKKLGDKCRQKPEGLSPEDKSLWVKANAVDMTMSSQTTALDYGGPSLVDPAECM